ncbi:MAG TPA: rod shape-determining protein MreC [Thiolapillus brandeum]|uniref:Cell shape-determining protein MreC n=1 Tax=Thiolapillus brandeum TaxID=1076588 RepID=A0A7C5IZG9_9GAMM|nr:rod shape-determining protein MreC [Thiolapillus brandeum]
MMLSILLMVLDHRFHQTETLRSVLATLTYPIQLLAELPADIGGWIADSLKDRSRLEQENRDLRRENLELKAELQQLASLQAENERLRDLLGSAYKIGNRVLVAELSAMDLDPFRQQVVINKGSASGVFAGQAVLDAHAVMGQVTHVTPLRATVLLITDAHHALPVQVLRNGLRTIAVGTGRIDRLELPYLPNNADIREGDLLVTSGLGGKFPPGYPVARIAGVERVPGKPFARVTATPLAQLDRTREVLLVWEVTPPEMEEERPVLPAAPPGSPAQELVAP